MAIDFIIKSNYNMEDLLSIMGILRSPDGCPWDREQTHESIRNNFVEETYEVLDAIDRECPQDLCEELGDVLLQVVFHSQIDAESGGFCFDDVTDGICKKLIERHPHVFGKISVTGTEQVLENWEAIKQRTKNQTTAAQTLESVPKVFPALMRAAKVQKRAAKAGFDWDNSEGAFLKIQEEMKELCEAAASGNKEAVYEELGDLLFSVVNVSRFLKIDAEQALQSASDKFTRRFTAVEALAQKQNIDMKNSTIEQLDLLWDEVKEKEKTSF